MNVEIKNRYSCDVLFTAEIECDDSATREVRLGPAIKAAIAARADLAGADLAGADLARADLARADLAGAYLTGANLTGANLTGANLTGANLTGANLARANLARAYLAGANLTGAYLTGAYLAGANLTGADLTGAYLAGANLTGADLTGANLARADLTGANLTGAKWNSEITINRAPLQLYHLTYPVIILDEHMQIGCELHSLKEWAEFDDERIARMDGLKARRFWDKMKAPLLALAEADGRRIKEKQE